MPRVILVKFAITIEIKKTSYSIDFFSERKQCAGKDITFEIKSIIEKTNDGNINYCEQNNELDELKNGFSNDDRRNSKRAIQ